MIDIKYIEDEYEEGFQDEDYDDNIKIKRLRTTLENRIKLVNLFKKMINKYYIPLKIENLKINLDDINEISNFIHKNTIQIESYLKKDVDNWIVKNGTKFQKNRIAKNSSGEI